MINNTTMSISNYVKKVAIPSGKFHFHKSNGKLTGYKPAAGQLMVGEGFTYTAKVVKAPNSAKDFLIEYEDGTKERKNLVNNDIEGFLDV